MNYEFWFFMLIAFIVGRISVLSIVYIGCDEEKYNDAIIGFLLKK